MATVSSIRDGLKTRLATITGLRAYDLVPNDVQAVAAVVEPASGTYHTSFAPAHTLRFVIRVVVPITGGIEKAQDLLDPYLDDAGSTSIRVAIEGDGTLGGVVDDLVVQGWRDYGIFPVGGIEYLGAAFDVEVYL